MQQNKSYKNKPNNYVSLAKQKEIEDLILNIFFKTDCTYPDHSLTEIIKKYIPGIKIVQDDFHGNKHIGGAIFRKTKNKFDEDLIAIQKDQSEGKKNFALAHEFAHYILGHDGKERYLIEEPNFNGTKIIQDEAEANFFAAALLMPRDKFLKLDVPFFTDAELAKRFGVTIPMIRVRREWLKSNAI